MPLAGEIAKAYVKYYTHSPPSQTTTVPAAAPAGFLRSIFRRMKHGYLQATYGYPMGLQPAIAATLGILFRLLPGRRGKLNAELRWLQAVPRGCLLDVGCGSGRWLVHMRQLGWQVTGVDFDPGAVAIGRQQGLELACGSLEQQAFPAAGFDAITMNHVIEHLPDPVGTLRECRRLLKDGGKLVLVTPNSSSLGHRCFRQNWRGLEPPRHLHLFSPASLRAALAAAGFEQIELEPLVAPSVLYESILLRRNCWTNPESQSRRTQPAWLLACLLGNFERTLTKAWPGLADFLLGIALK